MNLKDQVLIAKTRQELEQECPNLFINQGHSRTSDKYIAINVWQDVVVPLMSLGWRIRWTSRRDSKTFGDHAAFVIRMFNPQLANDERAPEIIIRASHNRREAVTFRMGFVEFICKNGLIVISEEVKELANIRILHKGEIEGKIKSVIKIIESETNKVNAMVKAMRMSIMTPEQIRQFAEDALTARGLPRTFKHFDIEETIKSVTASPRLYNPNIIGQDGNSLFELFQRVQGRLVDGQVFIGTKTKVVRLEKEIEAAKKAGDNTLLERLNKKLSRTVTTPSGKKERRKKARGIVGIDAIMSFNERLFGVATKYIDKGELEKALAQA